MAKERVHVDVEKVIELHKSGLSAAKISKELGVYLDKISKILRENGFVMMNNAQRSKLMQSEVDWDKAIKMYEEGTSLENVAKEFNKTYDFIRAQFLKRGVEIRDAVSCHVQDRKYTHKNIFSPMTNEGAYLLGWLMSDGNITRKRSVRLYLGEEDKEHVYYLASLFTDSPVKSEYRESTGKWYYGFHVVDVTIYNTLMEIGLEPRKSYNAKDINWDFLTEDQFAYFLLGMLEGDGHVAKNSNMVGMIMFDSTLESMKKKFLDRLGINITKITRDPRWSMKELKYVKFLGEDYFKFMTSLYLYTPDVQPLKRKRERFLENCERVANSKSKHREIARRSLMAVKV